MPNGFQGSDAEWRRMEGPLLQADPILKTFATAQSLSVTKNYHNWPERSVTWGAPIRRLIQLYLEDSDRLTLNLWLCASEDRGSSRYWRREFLVKDRRLEDFPRDLPALLKEAYSTVNSWTADELEFATNVSI
jgi:hypothetical protein